MLYLRRVSGRSMEPALRAGSIVIIWSGGRGMRRGDVIMFDHRDIEKIKRIRDIRENMVYVCGDNPNASTDSRHFGWIPVSTVRGRVIWPLRL